MSKQLAFVLSDDDAATEALLRFVQPLGLSPRAVAVLVGLRLRGQRCTIAGQSCTRWAKSKHEAAAALGMAGATYLAGLADLEAVGVVGVVRTTRPWTVVLSWDRLAQLEPPPDPMLALPLFGGAPTPEPRAEAGQLSGSGRAEDGQPAGNLRAAVGQVSGSPGQPAGSCRAAVGQALGSLGQPSGSLGQGARGSVNTCVSKIREIRGSADPRGPARSPAELRALPAPWHREDGFRDADLVRCVRDLDTKSLRHLYDQAVTKGWIQDSEDARLRFLTVAHHCATIPGLHSRMAALVARCKAGVGTERTRQESEQWAAAVMRGGHRDPQLQEVVR